MLKFLEKFCWIMCMVMIFIDTPIGIMFLILSTNFGILNQLEVLENQINEKKTKLLNSNKEKI